MFKVLQVELRVHPMHTRFPFRYGIASLSALPHLFVAVDLEVDGRVQQGLASEGLPPKWFTKNPRTTTTQDLEDMLTLIRFSARTATTLSLRGPLAFFPYWQALHKQVNAWGFRQGYPGLLCQLGLSLIERAILDALCKASEMTLHQLVHSKALAVDWSIIHPGLEDHGPGDFLPAQPLSSTAVRHTVGLGDPIRTDDIPRNELLMDGLPQSLEEVITVYGIRYFKIKLHGDVMKDIARLVAISDVIYSHCGQDFEITLDGNESFQMIEEFRQYYTRLSSEKRLHLLLEKLLWVEQPLHRSKALEDHVGKELAAWPNAPRLIIDESDGHLGDAHKALKLGYSGVSHKNCKGILKGLTNAALIHHHRRLRPKKTFILSGEDLANVGPIALTQDLAMMALLGIEHVERNGHHYFRGLTMYSNDLAELTALAHPDLYHHNERELVTLNIQQGRISLQTVNSFPFGCGLEPALSPYPLLKDWIDGGGLQSLTS